MGAALDVGRQRREHTAGAAFRGGERQFARARFLQQSKGRLLDVLVQDRRKGFGFRHFFLSSNPGDTEPAARSECSHSEIRRNKWTVNTSRTQPTCSSPTTARWRGFSRRQGRSRG